MFKRFLNNESGQGAAEYALLLAAVAAVIVGVVFLFGGHIKDIFTNSDNSIQSNIPQP